MGALVLVLVVLLHSIGIDRYVTIAWMQAYAVYLQRIVTAHYIFAVICFIMVIVGATISAIPITVLLTMLGGFLFGTIYGAIYAVLGATIGGVLLFWLVRYVIGDVIQKRYERELAIFNAEIEEYGYQYLFLLQLVPFTPTVLINLLTGLTRISSWTFFWTAILGMLPFAILYSWVGQYLPIIEFPAYNVFPRMAILYLVVLVLLLVFVLNRRAIQFWLFYRKRK